MVDHVYWTEEKFDAGMETSAAEESVPEAATGQTPALVLLHFLQAVCKHLCLGLQKLEEGRTRPGFVVSPFALSPHRRYYFR